MEPYGTETRSAVKGKKIKVAVVGTDLLTPTQIEDLAKQQIRREFADFIRDISGGQKETYTPTPEDIALWETVQTTGELTFHIADCLANKGERGEQTSDGMISKLAKKADLENLTDEEILLKLRAARAAKEGNK